MKIKFCKKSGLENRTVFSDFTGFEYIPESRKGIPEYILISDKVPGRESEPDLYRDANVDDKNPEELHLSYEGLPLEVIRTTPQEDKKFKEQHPKIAEENILFELFD